MIRFYRGKNKQVNLHRKTIVFGIVAVFAISSIFVVGSENYDAMSSAITGSISGNVFQANGNPIFDATVEDLIFILSLRKKLKDMRKKLKKSLKSR